MTRRLRQITLAPTRTGTDLHVLQAGSGEGEAWSEALAWHERARTTWLGQAQDPSAPILSKIERSYASYTSSTEALDSVELLNLEKAALNGTLPQLT